MLCLALVGIRILKHLAKLEIHVEVKGLSNVKYTYRIPTV